MTTRPESDADVDRRLAQLEREVVARCPPPPVASGGPTDAYAGSAATARRFGRERERASLGWKFLLGVVLMLFGAWGVLSNVVVTSGFVGGGLFGFFPTLGGGGFGWTLLPIVTGIALVVARGGLVGKIGWLLIVTGFAFVFAQVLSSMRIWFRPVELPILLLMFAPLGVGLGLMLSDLLNRGRTP